MACFAVTTMEAIVVTAVSYAIKRNEMKKVQSVNCSESVSGSDTLKSEKIGFASKLNWLANLLWGGSFLLAFEHIWHGEVVAWFPFLTAAANPADAMQMLYEMATVGVSMAALITVVWVGMVLVSNAMTKKIPKSQTSER